MVLAAVPRKVQRMENSNPGLACFTHVFVATVNVHLVGYPFWAHVTSSALAIVSVGKLCKGGIATAKS